MTIRDSAEDSAAAAGDVLELCKMVNESPKWSLWWCWCRCKLGVGLVVAVVGESGWAPCAGYCYSCSGTSDGCRAAFPRAAGTVRTQRKKNIYKTRTNAAPFLVLCGRGVTCHGLPTATRAHVSVTCVIAVAWFSIPLSGPCSVSFSTWSQSFSRS